MKVTEGKQKFIHTWGRLGANWGINRTVASVHALLLVSADAMNADEIMAELKISRGNANMNLRELMNWGLVHKEIIRGDRKEYFVAEKNLVKVAKLIMKERRKRELDPIVKTLAELQTIEGDKKDKHVKAYLETVKGLKDLTTKADGLIELMPHRRSNALSCTTPPPGAGFQTFTHHFFGPKLIWPSQSRL